MSWECAECGAVEGKDGVKIEAMCHHCGKPLCQKHRLRVADEAFSSDSTPISRAAYHCDECKKAYYPRGVLVEPQVPV